MTGMGQSSGITRATGRATSSSHPKRGLHSEAARTSTACRICRDKKVKCSGEQPCRYCSKRQLSCEFSVSEKRKLYSVSEVRELQSKLARYEKPDVPDPEPGLPPPVTDYTVQGTPPSSAGLRDPSPSSDQTVALPPPTPSSAFSHPSRRVHEADNQKFPPNPPSIPKASAIALEPAFSSSETFGSEIRTLLVARSQTASAKSTPTDAPLAPSPHLTGDVLASIHDWPSEDEANTLLDLVILNVGISQHLFDIRSFSDNLSRLYNDTGPGDRALSLPGLWLVQVLLVLGLGRLLQARQGPDGQVGVPGKAFFDEAVRHTPHAVDMRRHGILAVEIAGLTALFLQVADQKEEAYIYASMALRLAISSGMHKTSGGHKYSRSEVVHRNRLWWSLYMQERRLAAAGGHPMAISDAAISTAPPADVPGFPSASATRVNIRLAQITGNITSTIYSHTVTSETSFVADVQNILHSLHEVEKNMPPEYRMDFVEPELKVAGLPFKISPGTTARTSSSLYTTVYQAVIHTVRPILLHMARNTREHDTEAVTALSPTIRRLGEICVEAAHKSLTILQALRDAELIAKNAFLDLDILFSVGFIFVLVEIINPGKRLGQQAIEGARNILQYLVSVGNRAAAKRLTELNQMCAHLGPQPEEQALHVQPATQFFNFEMPLMEPMLQASDSGELGDGTDLASISLEGEDLLGVYYMPGFVFTGEELTDWEALENQMAWSSLP